MLRLSPLDPLRPYAWQGRSFAYSGLERFEEAYEDSRRAMQFLTNAQVLCAFIVGAVLSGGVDAGRQAAAKWLELQPSFRLSMVKDAFPAKLPKHGETLLIALRTAGMPE